MADKADGIRQEIKKARQDIAEIRSAMTEKRALLEDRVQETVAGVKHAFDLPYQVEQRPWLMLGGSLLVGYTLGRRGDVSSTTADTSSEPSSRAQPQQRIVSEVSWGRSCRDQRGILGAVVSTCGDGQTVCTYRGPIEGAITKPGANPWKAHK